MSMREFFHIKQKRNLVGAFLALAFLVVGGVGLINQSASALTADDFQKDSSPEICGEGKNEYVLQIIIQNKKSEVWVYYNEEKILLDTSDIDMSNNKGNEIKITRYVCVNAEDAESLWIASKKGDEEQRVPAKPSYPVDDTTSPVLSSVKINEKEYIVDGSYSVDSDVYSATQAVTINEGESLNFSVLVSSNHLTKFTAKLNNGNDEISRESDGSQAIDWSVDTKNFSEGENSLWITTNQSQGNQPNLQFIFNLDINKKPNGSFTVDKKITNSTAKITGKVIDENILQLKELKYRFGSTTDGSNFDNNIIDSKAIDVEADGSFTITLDLTDEKYIDGKYLIDFIATDEHGLKGMVGNKTAIEIDKTKPTFSVVYNGNNISEDGFITAKETDILKFTISASDKNGLFQLQAKLSKLVDESDKPLYSVVANESALENGEISIEIPVNMLNEGERYEFWIEVMDAISNNWQENNATNGTANFGFSVGVPPTGTISYSPTKWTKDNVTATLTTNEPIVTPDGWTPKDGGDGKVFTKLYQQNTTETIELTDLAGNVSTVNVEIKNIDKILPEINPSEPTIDYELGILKPNVTFSDEGGSEVKSTSCAIYPTEKKENILSPSVTPCGEINISSLKDGDYYLHYYAIDGAGNMKGEKGEGKAVTQKFSIFWPKTVTFLLNGEEYSTDTVKIAGPVARPDDPEKEGHTFNGWYTDEECTDKFDFNTVVDADLTLYAKWAPVADPVNPDDEDGDGGDPTDPSTPTDPSNPQGGTNQTPSNTSGGTGSPSSPLAVTPVIVGGVTSLFANAVTAATPADDAVATTAVDDETSVAATDTQTNSTSNRSDNSKDSNAEVLGATDAKNWSLVNLILAALIALASVITLLGWLGRKDDGNRHGFLRLLTLVPAVGAAVLFFLVEDWSLPMQMFNSWTWLMLAIAVVQIVLIVVATRGKSAGSSALSE